MRYFIFYPPSKSIKLIDVSENDRVEDILELVQRKFGLKVYDIGSSETSIVLSYNGFDLKPKWSLSDLNIPSGAIIRCIYREQKAADLYIDCGFNKQILKLFDSSITIETKISTIRKKISDKLGLPLSTFCLEKYDGNKRLYDEMKLFNCDVKIHDHIYLKVWKGHEKFISSCVKGFTEHYSRDDLTRYYEAQVALYIAAFYGHMELASSVMQHGARSDRPVGEHPSRQWSSETMIHILPEMLKCPIHIAIERGHVKMVDLFVRQSILCTQIRDPIKNYLPYRLALSCLLSAKTKEEKQCYNEIYYYLHDKQFNLKIPLNANGEYVINLLTSTTTTNAVHRSLTHHVNVSLPFYCKIISWYERAHEKAWKKYGGHFPITTQTKRVYPKKGLLGYKVLIDGYNHTFEAPIEQQRGIRSSNTYQSDQADRYVGFTDEEREKIIRMKIFMKQFALDERQRAKQIAAVNLQQSRRPPLLLHPTSADLNKHPITTIQSSENFSFSSEFSNSQILPNISTSNIKVFQSMLDTDNSSINKLLPLKLNSHSRIENSHESKERPKRMSKTLQPVPLITVVNEYDKPTIPIIVSPISNSSTTYSTLTNKLQTVANANKQVFHPIMSSAHAFSMSLNHRASASQQQKAAKRHELFTQVEHSLQHQQPQQQKLSEESTIHLTNPLGISLPADHSSVLDLDSYIPLPDHSINIRSGSIKSRTDLEIHQSAIKSYERYTSASIRSTAIDCLQEASFFKRKTWLKQVEISKEMIKHKVQRRIRRADNDTNKKSALSPLRATIPTTSFKSNTVTVN